MTSESRLTTRMSALGSQSAWSPMPEHLLTLRLEETDALETFRGSDPDDGHICDTCGMVFKTKAMTIYHKVAFCVGTPVSENMHSYDVERTSESINLVNLKSSGRGTDGNKHGDGDVSSDGKPKECQKRVSGPIWCKASHGQVPEGAMPVDDVDGSDRYVCLVNVGEERIPGMVSKIEQSASVAVNGTAIKVTDYEAFKVPSEQFLWKRCDVIGAIPCGAVEGGHNDQNLQYFIARATAADGSKSCGQYVPQIQKCIYAWNGSVYETNSFEFLCRGDKGRAIRPT